MNLVILQLWGEPSAFRVSLKEGAIDVHISCLWGDATVSGIPQQYHTTSPLLVSTKWWMLGVGGRWTLSFQTVGKSPGAIVHHILLLLPNGMEVTKTCQKPPEGFHLTPCYSTIELGSGHTWGFYNCSVFNLLLTFVYLPLMSFCHFSTKNS